jgi:hypothetical protein
VACWLAPALRNVPKIREIDGSQSYFVAMDELLLIAIPLGDQRWSSA